MRNPRRKLFVLLIAILDVAVILYGVHVHDRNNTTVPTAVSSIPPTVPVQTPTAQPALVPTISSADTKSATSYSEPLLSAVDELTAWRAIGYCHQGQFMTTTDSAYSLYPLQSPTTFILNIHRTGTKTGWLIGSAYPCDFPEYFRTSDGGTKWRHVSSLGRIWVPLPIGLLGPSGTVTRPCGSKHPAPISFASAGLGGVGLVICRHGVFRSTNGGKSWKPTGEVTSGTPAAVALAKNGNGVMLMTNDPQCKGARILQTVDAAATWTVGPCLRVVQPPLTMSIADSGQGLLVSLTSRYRTIDFGRTWD